MYFNETAFQDHNNTQVIQAQPKQDSGGAIILVIVGASVLFLLNAVGINLVYLVNLELHHFFRHIYLDRGQLWSIAVLVSIAMFLILFWARKSFKSAALWYLLINSIVVGVDVLLLTLFHIELLKTLIFVFFGLRL
jgi:hypothetical protein